MPLDGYRSLCAQRASVITSKDKRNSKTTHIANNVRNNYVTKYRIDGEVITEGARCDFLLMNEDAGNAYLIELKGSDLVKAAEQLEETRKKLVSELSAYQVYYRIVANKCSTHKIHLTNFRKYQIKWGDNLKYASIQMVEDI